MSSMPWRPIVQIDAACLRGAKLEHLERLACSLRVAVPPDWLTDEARKRQLVQALAKVLAPEGAKEKAV
jgi:hypothetical protein